MVLRMLLHLPQPKHSPKGASDAALHGRRTHLQHLCYESLQFWWCWGRCCSYTTLMSCSKDGEVRFGADNCLTGFSLLQPRAHQGYKHQRELHTKAKPCLQGRDSLEKHCCCGLIMRAI